jgi:isoleucyl-tRNA synthetase
MTNEPEKQKESPQYDPKRVEQQIIDFWKANNTFEKSITTKSEDQPYRFYDGPPFITWLPHYGSLLSSVVKDVVTRYWTQKWKRIDRVRWWDCHGIYVEQKVQEKLWYTSNKDIEAKWIDGFIKWCYDFTKDVSDQWDWYVDHIGRWVDFKNAYKTMDNNYMESVMRVFKSLWDKGLIYKGKRVSLYSTNLNTPISNYEVALDNGYADISDPAITVKFPVVLNKIEDKAYAYTDDGFLRVITAVIKNDAWQYLFIHRKVEDYRCCPWWRVKQNETEVEALQRILQKEIVCEWSSFEYIWSYKKIIGGKPIQMIFYSVNIAGVPVLNEPEHHAGISWTSVEKTDSELWYAVKFDWILLEERDDIIRSFVDVYVLESIAKEWHAFDLSSAPLSFIAWTTTPRTIPTNLALVVNPDLRYIQLFDKISKEYFVMAESLVSKYFKNTEDYIVIYRCRGSELTGISYKPPFDFYTTKGEQNHKVYAASYVTDSDGTGIVHTAPEFGEEDFQTGLKNSLFQTEALDLEGKYTAEIAAYQWMYYRDANDAIMKDLKDMWALMKKESITHSVAMCPRTGVPLIYKAQDAWFINIQAIKEKLFENNEKIHWIPEHLKHGRFLKSMEGAPDRCISRTRFWATPMPVWKAQDSDDMIVVGSLAEIYELDQAGSKQLEKRLENGKTIYRDTKHQKEFDLHRPNVDDIRGVKDGKKYTRIPEVLDPWLDSWSMPYAQVHYPFENKEKFEASFPADYVAEYVGQVRAWFFFMHAISTMLTMPAKLEWGKLVKDKPVLPLPENNWDSPAFTNVVCTGVLAWNDGRKMSKSYGNYPDPKETIEWYGWDAIRMYLASSPIVVGGDMNFSEEWLKETYKKFILPLWNSYYFFSTYAGIDKFVTNKSSLRDLDPSTLTHPLDRWMALKAMELVNAIDTSMQSYDMQTASLALIRFMDDLTNRYIRRSRRRFRESGAGSEMWKDKRDAYTVLYCVLTEICLVSAPFTPLIAEYIYKQLSGKESVHLEEPFKQYDLEETRSIFDPHYVRDNLNEKPYNLSIGGQSYKSDEELMMWFTKDIVSLWLSLRWQKKIRVKQPLSRLILSSSALYWFLDAENTRSKFYLDIIKEELNIKKIEFDKTLEDKVQAVCKPNARLLGKKFGKDMQTVITAAKSGNFVLQDNGHVLVAGQYDLTPEEFEIEYAKWDVPFDVAINGSLIVALDDTLTDELRLEWDARDLIRYIQEARKAADYNMDTRIELAIDLPQDAQQAKDMPYKSDIQALLTQFGELITGETLATLVDKIDAPDQQETVELEMVGKVRFGIKQM